MNAASACFTRRHYEHRAKELTMACWWKSPIMGKLNTDWAGVVGELWSLREGELFRGNTEGADEIYRVIMGLGK